MSDKIKKEYYQKWKDAYDALNGPQKRAVDTIEGPVMAIAGPGTGKTQLLSVRIGNILLRTDAYPQNILCLTFTDAGTVAMRQRLESFIGPDAYNVSVQTFHSFCHAVIKDNMSYFSDYRELQQVTDIEEVDIFRKIIDNFDSRHILKRHKGDVYFDYKRLKSLFSIMKQENYRPVDFKKAYEAYEKKCMDPATSDFVYSRKTKDKKTGHEYQKGDLKMNAIRSELDKYAKTVAAAEAFDEYTTLMAQSSRMDFNDMILFVLDKFKEHDHLLGKYQEQYQYVLVDEYQDTNGVQNELLFLLAEYWERPNVFIVGDDDQSIYRFQGANMDAIVDFKLKYAPEEIILTHNYRSSQVILDAARKLIQNNQDRLVARFPYLIKDLKEARNDKGEISHAPQIIEYPNATHEEVGIIQKIEELYQAGIPYKDIGVIYTKHAFVENITKYLTIKKIPINVKKRINVLGEPDVIKLCRILEYIDMEREDPHSGESVLFEVLHYDIFDVSPTDVASLSLYCKNSSLEQEDSRRIYKKWRLVMQDADELASTLIRNKEDILRVSSLIENWIKDSFNVTVQLLIERIITESHLLDHMLKSEDKAYRLQAFNTFFDFIKNEAASRGGLTVREAVELIHVMNDEEIPLEVNRVFSNKGGVNFMTVHGSKGLEFKHVFIMRCNENTWEKRKGNNQGFSFPPGLVAASDLGSEEDERRLFFVALTRARDFVYISYISKDDKEKDQQMSKFISEIRHADDKISQVSVDDQSVQSYLADLMRYHKGQPALLDHALMDRVLENFKLSTTSLNKYLKCPLSFYFENILGVPRGRNAQMGFGSAIHYALEQYFMDIEKSSPRSMGSVQKLIDFFIKGMEIYKSHFTQMEFGRLSEYGINTLNEYYAEHHEKWMNIPQYKTELNISLVHFEGIPLTGKLDRVNIYKDFVTVTDYKTGKFSKSKSKLNGISDNDSQGGDYWRQIVFYRILLDNYKGAQYHMTHGIMDFVEKEGNKFEQAKITTDHSDVESVGKQITETYQKIKNHEFSEGCGDEKCTWCNFVKRNMPSRITESDEE